MHNVLTNATCFSPPGGQIDVTTGSSDSGSWRLQVTGRGPGIPEAGLEMDLEAFVHSSHSKDGPAGAGMGLASRRTILQSRGRHTSAHHRDGGGSVFQIELPMRGNGATRPALRVSSST
ncbi:MAG: sensor histidine kinase [Rubrivivax sp.]|nr:sensor histidine kinase [Rubrivivax sp.]